MKLTEEKGLTLVELLVAIMVLGLISVVITVFLSSAIQAQTSGSKRSALYHEGLMAMNRMTEAVRRCTYLTIPNSQTPTRNMLAVSGFYNDDNDFYFDDPLFPRIDEDAWYDMNSDGDDGIDGVDDDGDGSMDEGFWGTNDDESWFEDEDPVDGIDNDGDGNIDEDSGADMNGDSDPGIVGIDDDGDGEIDEGNNEDDDEDGQRNEDPLNAMVFSIPSGTVLREKHHYSSLESELSDKVTFFQVTYEAPERILIELTLTGDEGENVTFKEYVYPRNTLQKTGKRVR